MIRVAVFDGSPIFELGLTEFIRRSTELELVEVEPDGSASMDVCLADADLWKLDSLRQSIQRAAGVAPVLLTAEAEADRALLEAGIVAGAVGVLDRRAPAEVLLSQIRAVAAGAAARVDRHEAPGSAEVDLSQRERQVLHKIAEGMTHVQIAELMNISRNTVDTYVKRIRAKLGVGNKAELTRLAMSSTYLRRPWPSGRAAHALSGEVRSLPVSRPPGRP